MFLENFYSLICPFSIHKKETFSFGKVSFRYAFLCKHVFQPLEEAFAFLVVVFFQGALKFLQGIALDLVQLLGDLDLALDVHVAPAAAVQILDALATQAERGAALGALGHGVLHLAVNGRDGDVSPRTAWL